MLRDMRRRGRVRERIVRVLLNEPDGVLSKYRVSKKAGSSFSWVHEYLKKLEGLGLINGTRVVDYRGLVENWRKVRIKPEREEYLHRSPLDLLKKQVYNTLLRLIRRRTLFSITSSLRVRISILGGRRERPLA